MNKFKIHFLNTIWSDAILLEKNNHFSFIDTGSSFYYPMIEEYLEKLNIKTIDFIFLTHFHNDHYGNVKNIIDNYQVKTLYLKHYHGLDGTTSSGYASNEEYIENEFKNYYNILDSAKNHNVNIIFIDDLEHTELDSMTIQFEDVLIDAYDISNRLYEMYSNPESEFYQQKKFNENFNCAGLFIKYNNQSIFLGADVTCSKTDIENLKELSIKMLDRIYFKYDINKINLYKSCHHGGGGTNTDKLCNYLKADYVIITNTARWLDTYDTYDNLEKANEYVRIFTTDFHKVIFTIDEELDYETIPEKSLFLTLGKN